MHNKNKVIPNTLLIIFRSVFYFLAFYFFLMGFMLAFFPQFLTKIAGPQHPVILGMLRGAGGSIIPYSLIYIFIAVKPIERQWAAFIIAFANVVAIIMDIVSFINNEYLLSYAMIDIPFEFMSRAMIIIFYSYFILKIKKLN